MHSPFTIYGKGAAAYSHFHDPVKRQKVMDRAEPATFDELPNSALENTATCMSQDLTIL